VTLRCELDPFTLMDTAAYIASRIRTAGGEPARLFSLEAVTLVHGYSRGIPRMINVICDNALVSAMGLGTRWVDQTVVAEVCRDLRLEAPEPETHVESSPAPTSHASPPPAAAAPVVSKPSPLEDALPVRDEAAGGTGRREYAGLTSAGRSSTPGILKLNEPH
jgi:general secretion pathway protein A